MLEATEVYVSAASVWEIAIKRTLGKIDVDADTFASAVRDSGFISLAITTGMRQACSRCLSTTPIRSIAC